MKYSVTPGRISNFVKIVNFVGEPTSERGPPVAVIPFIKISALNKSMYLLAYILLLIKSDKKPKQEDGYGKNTDWNRYRRY